MTLILDLNNITSTGLDIKSTLMDSQRGQLFIAEHIFGKPKDISEVDLNVNEFSIKDIFRVDNKPKS